MLLAFALFLCVGALVIAAEAIRFARRKRFLGHAIVPCVCAAVWFGCGVWLLTDFAANAGISVS